MRKIISITFMAIATGISSFVVAKDISSAKKSWDSVQQDFKVVNICDISEQELNRAMQGQFSELAVEFSENTILPLKLFLKGELVHLLVNKDDFEQVEVKKTFYARLVEGELFLSSNLSEWKPFLEFITGNISVFISVQDGKPSAEIGAEINLRL